MKLWGITCLVVLFPEFVLYMLAHILHLLPRQMEIAWFESLDARLEIIENIGNKDNNN